jgi:hypothetical protein
VVPHHPFTEQQVPKVLPVHVCPDVPPQVASGLTVSVEVEVEAVLLLVDELLDFEVEVEVFVDDVEDFDKLDEPVPVQVPEAGLQPAPQYEVVLPQ